ncbi:MULTISPECIES: division/cell wall cluster transcriptional repressor MraZ [Cohaesibacter]|uniref:division/cell wall cluster transcriptional repressor MraZ n=1 Tax=Cohaesibacter TaxID=655352 RepID=UPI000DE9B1E2|nr:MULTISPECIES: division/cell wall cluster transcriptional repressor MraZ [Cohaesibacter]TLP48432.1 division/cell wall cluster transcriptional repressor MraZ [Cohaesibacter sp. CAU 1516]
MQAFVSKYVNRLDSKGRVSIPAPFRQLLAQDGQDSLFCSPSLDQVSIEAGGLVYQQEINDQLNQFDPFSEEREMLSTALLGESETFKIDKDGRIVLSESIKEYAGITDVVVFVGQGTKFRLWQPDRYEVHRKEAQKLALSRIRQGKTNVAPKEGQGGGDEA